MRLDIKKCIISIFILIVTFITASEQKIPNVMILDNPTKEVSTVEGLKNREAAEMNIKVKKRNIEEIVGVKSSDGIEFVLPDGILVDEEIKVVKSLANLPTNSPGAKRRKRDAVAPVAATVSEVIVAGDKKIVKIPTEEAENTNYILKINKKNNEISKIYKGSVVSAPALLADYTYTMADIGVDKRAVGEFKLYDTNSPLTTVNWKWLAGYKSVSINQTSYDEYKVKNNSGLTTPYHGMQVTYEYMGNANVRYFQNIKDGYGRSIPNYHYAGNISGPNGETSKFAREQNCYTALYNSLMNPIRGWYTSVYGQFPNSNNAQVGKYKLQHNMQFVWNSYTGNLTRTTIYSNVIVRDSLVENVDYIINSAEINKKVPIAINGAQELSFYNSNKENIRIYKDGVKVSTDGKASFTGINGNDFDILFEQVVGESAKPYIIMKKLVSEFTQPLTVELWFDGYKLKTYNVTLKLVKKDIGEVEFQVDKRLNDNTKNGYWLRTNGAQSNGINATPHDKEYPELINLNGNFTGLESTNIADINSIEGRPVKSSTTLQKIFMIAAGDYNDESAMPFGINLNTLKNSLVISMANSNNANLLNNRFLLQGANGIFYGGNVKESYLGQSALEGVAMVDISGLPVGGWARWDTPEVTGDATSTVGTLPTIMKFKSGKLFNFKSAVKNSTGHIVTKLKVTDSKNVVDEIPLTVNAKGQTSKFANNAIGIESSGGIFITKKIESIVPETYDIEAYYQDILLGKLKVTVQNSSLTEVGEVEFKVDNRLKNNSKGSWIRSNGGISNGIDGAIHDVYPELINLAGNFTGLESTNVADISSIEGRPVKYDNRVGYKVFLTAAGVYVDEAGMVFNINLNALKDNLIISKNNSNDANMLNNRFVLKGTNNKFYKGNIKENYLGQSALEGVANLDMTGVPVGDYSGWNTPEATGEVQNTGGRPTVMKFSSGKFFNFKSAVKSSTGHIVTKLKVTASNGESGEATGTVGGKVQVNNLTDNTIGIDGAGIFIAKKTENITPVTYDIEAYYKDILLGKLKVTVTNATEVNVGEVEFQVDNRLKDNTKNGYWVVTNGAQSSGSGTHNTYPELVNLNGNFTNLESTNVDDVSSIEGRPRKTGNATHKIFTMAAGNFNDESAMPFGINLSGLRNNLIISMYNSNNANMLNNIFTLKGANGKFYKGNVKENYLGQSALEGVANLDMTAAGVNTWSGWNTPEVTGDAPSTIGSASTVMKFTRGKLFNFRSSVKSSTSGFIVTELRVSDSKGQSEVVGVVNGKLETSKFANNVIGIHNTGLFITKLTESTTPETYDIEAYYKDILLGKLEVTVSNSSLTEIGEVVFKVDNRVPKSKLIFPNGDIKTTRNGSVEGNYPELINLEGNYTKLESTRITDAVSVEGRNFKNGTANDITRFDKTSGQVTDSSYIPTNFDLSAIKAKILIDSTNSNPLASGMENNIFTIKGANGKFYKGNAKETYLGQSALVGEAMVDMTGVTLGGWSRWDTPEVMGDATSTAGTLPTVMKFSSGKLFNFKSAAKNSTGHIVTKLKVTASNGESEEVSGTVNSKIQTTSKITNSQIGIEASGGLFITKLTENTTPVTYDIEAYYKDILLGKLKVTVTNATEVNVGEVEFKVDNRLKNSTNGDWLKANGAQSGKINGTIHNTYPELINLNGNFTGLESINIPDVNSIEGRPFKYNGYTGYKVFQVASTNYIDESAMPFGINLNTLKDNLIISKNNSNDANMLNNRFALKGENGKFYKGNVKENYLGQSALEGVANLDMTAAGVNTWSGWNTPEVTGDVPSTEGTASTVMKFTSGKLFNFRSSVKSSTSGFIVTELRVSDSKGQSEVAGVVNGKLQTSKFANNIIGIHNTGLFINKLTESTTPETYDVEAYYKDILLGKLKVTVTNATEVNVGEVEFQVDNRLKDNTKNGYWIRANGAQSGGIAAAPHDTYPELVNLNGDFTGLESTNISDVISIEGRPVKTTTSLEKVFRIATGDYNDESAMPFGIDLNALKNGLVISMYNSNNANMLNNIFTLKGTNNKFYKGNVKESYLGQSALEGEAIVDMTGVQIGKYSGWNTPEATGDVQATGGTTSTVMKFKSGKLFNFKSAVKSSTGHIVTKLKVTASNGESDEATGTVGGKVQVNNLTDNTIGIDGAGIFIAKKTENTTPVTYDIEAYYKDILLGKLKVTVTNVTEVNVGEIEFKVDNRLKNSKTNEFWIRSNGGVSNGIGGNITLYPELVNLNGNFTGLESINISDINSIEGRPFKNNSILGYTPFTIASGDFIDESAMPFGINLNVLKDNLIISMYNSNNANMLNNIFTLKGANNKFYKGNVKESYLGQSALEGVAKLDMTGLQLGAWSRWDTPEVTGDAPNSLGSSTVMKFSSGKLFNFKSSVKNSTEHIVTKLIVKDSSGQVETVTSANTNINTKLETSQFANNIIGMETSGGIFIQKLTESTTPETYEIEAYYKDILLGKLKVNVTNATEVNIGEVEFKVDDRLKVLGLGSWIRSNGGVSNGIAGNVTLYPELVNLAGNFTGLESTNISDVISIEGRPVKSDYTPGYKVFTTASGVYVDEAAMPFDINLNTLKDNLIISKNNSADTNMLNNRFVLKGADGIFYKGNVKESYLGQSALEGEANLDMTTAGVNTWSGWNTPEVTGDAPSTIGTASTVMKFTSGKLFNFRSSVKTSTSGHIVTELRVSDSKGQSEIAGLINGKVQTSKFTNNVIGVHDTGLFITKQTESTTPETYDIEAYYEDVLLGKLKVTVTNVTEVNIGEVEFEADNRLKANSNGNWIKANGDLSQQITGAVHNTYPELINLSGNFVGLESTNIADVISIEGRPLKYNNRVGYKAFLTATGVYADESGMPYDIELNDLRNSLVISKNNSTDINMLNNRFVLKGANGKVYKGNVKEVYSGNKAIGSGKIDLATATENKIYTFEKSSTGVASAIEDANVKLNIAGQLPQTQGFRKENIVDNFKITINGGAEESIVGQSYTANPKYDICFDSTTGNLQIKKKQKNATYVDNVNIKYFYKDIELGEFTLEIENKGSSFEIVGDDVIDFGAIVQGQESKVEGTIVIKNLESRKILNVTLNDQKPIKVLKKNDSSVELPVVGDVSLLKRDIEVPIRVDLSAKPGVDQPVGDYEGEINLYIYIE